MSVGRIYGDTVPRIVKGFVAAAFVGGAVTLALSVHAWLSKNQGLAFFLAAAWAILPPAWFWCEFFFVYRRHGQPNTFDAFKYGQQLSLAIWAGVALTLGAVASSDHFKDAARSTDLTTPANRR